MSLSAASCPFLRAGEMLCPLLCVQADQAQQCSIMPHFKARYRRFDLCRVVGCFIWKGCLLATIKSSQSQCDCTIKLLGVKYVRVVQSA
jgi:hypothetical protein